MTLRYLLHRLQAHNIQYVRRIEALLSPEQLRLRTYLRAAARRAGVRAVNVADSVLLRPESGQHPRGVLIPLTPTLAAGVAANLEAWVRLAPGAWTALWADALGMRPALQSVHPN